MWTYPARPVLTSRDWQLESGNVLVILDRMDLQIDSCVVPGFTADFKHIGFRSWSSFEAFIVKVSGYRAVDQHELHVPCLSPLLICAFHPLIFIRIRQRISFILPPYPERPHQPPHHHDKHTHIFFLPRNRGSFKSLSPLCCRWIGAHLNWKRTWPSPLCFPRCLPKSQLSFVRGHARPRHVPFSGWMFAVWQSGEGRQYLIGAWKVFFFFFSS